MGFSASYLNGHDAAFISGASFRLFHSFDLTSGSPVTFEVVVSSGVILDALSLDLHSGEVVFETVVGGTPSGTFGTPITIFNRNNLDNAPAPTPPVTIAIGGSHTGGTLLDVLHAKTDSNNNRAASVGDTQDDGRGIATGTYYFRVVSVSASSGLIMRARFTVPTYTY